MYTIFQIRILINITIYECRMLCFTTFVSTQYDYTGKIKYHCKKIPTLFTKEKYIIFTLTFSLLSSNLPHIPRYHLLKEGHNRFFDNLYTFWNVKLDCICLILKVVFNICWNLQDWNFVTWKQRKRIDPQWGMFTSIMNEQKW